MISQRIARLQSVFRENGNEERDFKLFLICGIDDSGLLSEGEWLGYTENQTVRWPFIYDVRAGKLDFGGEERHYEETNLGKKLIKAGEMFTISGQEADGKRWESVYTIKSVHIYS